MARWSLTFGGLGFLASIAGALVSYLAATGNLPTVVFGHVRTFTTLRRVHGLPFEFVLAFGFLALFALQAFRRRRTAHAREDSPAHEYLLAVLLAGASLGLSLGSRSTAMHWIATLCAVAVLVMTSASTSTGARKVLSGTIAEIRECRRRPRALRIAVAFILFCTAVGAAMARHVEVTPSHQAAERNLIRWYESRTPIDSQDLIPDRGVVRLVVFSDYQCFACANLVPMYKEVITKFAARGLRTEMLVRDFPLDPECNGHQPVSVHPTACEASVAMRLVQHVRPEIAPLLESWMYARSSQLSAPGIREWLDEHKVRQAFDDRYAEILTTVRQDADMARAWGVDSTPTLFLNGVKVPTLTATGLDTLLRYTTARAGR